MRRNIKRCENIDEAISKLSFYVPKKYTINTLLVVYSIEEALKTLIDFYEKTNDVRYLSLVFFLPHQWFKEQIDQGNYFINLIKYSHFNQNPGPIREIDFMFDDVDKDVYYNIYLLSNYSISKKPLILGDTVIDLGNTDNPKLFDLIINEAIYDYKLLSTYEDEILDYFKCIYTNKSEQLVSEKIVYSSWSFNKRVKVDIWNTLIEELNELHGVTTPVLYEPYQLKQSVVKFKNTETRLVEFYYQKEFLMPEHVLENPLMLKSYLLFLSEWHMKKNRFHNVTMTIPNTNFIVRGNSMWQLCSQINHALPYLYKNHLKGIVKFSEKLQQIKNQYPLEYVRLELNNTFTYDALKVLDINSFSNFHSEIFEFRQQFNVTGINEVYKFVFLEKEYQYDMFSKFYTNLFTKLKGYKNYYPLTEASINQTFKRGFDFVMKISILTNDLFNRLDDEKYLLIRKYLSDIIKSKKYSDTEIFNLLANYIENNENIKEQLSIQITEDYLGEEEEILF